MGGGGGGSMDWFGHLLNSKKIGYIYKKKPFRVIGIFLKLEMTYIRTLIQEFVKNEESIHSI